MMNYQQSQKGYKMKYTKESFEEILQQAYSELESEDIHSLLTEVNECMCQDNFDNDFILSVFNSVNKKRNISFREWKALSAYVSDFRRKQNKTF